MQKVVRWDPRLGQPTTEKLCRTNSKFLPVLNQGRILSIFHGCEVRTEKSTMRVTVWHQEAWGDAFLLHITFCLGIVGTGYTHGYPYLVCKKKQRKEGMGSALPMLCPRHTKPSCSYKTFTLPFIAVHYDICQTC